jgi:regulation of enolase protein 1 (concanavalin A-like superfamily)
MPRVVVHCILVLGVSNLVAAPVPRPKTWVSGWDKPVCPEGCRLDPDGDKLTVTVPGEGYTLDVVGGRLNAPRLLRDLEGEFDLVVRVGAFSPPAEEGKHVYRRAGLVVLFDENVIRLERAADRSPGEEDAQMWLGVHRHGKEGGLNAWGPGLPLDKPAYLRLERRGDILYVWTSPDGKELDRYGSRLVELPKKLKVGVMAETNAPGRFQVEFDQFKLSRPGE